MGLIFPERNSWHRLMGPPADWPCCDGRGWRYETVPGTENDYIPDFREIYCDCEAGNERRRVEKS